MNTTDKLSSAKLNWKTWFFIVTIILAAGWAASQGATVFLDVSLEYRISDLENLTEEMQRLTIEQALNSSFYPMQKPCSFMVSKVGSYTVMQNGTDARLKWWSTDSYRIFRACEGNLSISGGIIFVKYAIYSMSDGFTHYKGVHLIGESMPKLDVTQNLASALITIDDADGPEYRSWAINGFYIDMNNYNGHAIYGGHVCDSGMRQHAWMEDIIITYVKKPYCGIWLKDPFRMYMNQIKTHSAGTNIKFSSSGDYSVHFGNSIFDNLFMSLASTADAIGLHIDGADGAGTKRPCNMAQFNRLQLGGNPSAPANTTGVWIDFSDLETYDRTMHFTFADLDIEGAMTAVYINNAMLATFIRPYFECTTAGSTGFKFEGASTKAISVYDGQISVGPGGLTIDDDSTSTTYPNFFYNVMLDAAENVDVNPNTYLINCENFLSKNIGSNTIASGNTLDSFIHGLYATPDHVDISWTEATNGTTTWWWTANATYIDLHLTASAGANWDYSWSAEIDVP